jgi:hypothetical protein
MTRALVDQVADAVLYEGYLLYPYRPSSVKNRQRWSFGVLYPRSYSEVQGGADAWTMQTECVVHGGLETVVHGRVRFLHLVERTVRELLAPLAALPVAGDPAFRTVAALPVGDQVFHSWQEVVEREVPLGDVVLSALVDRPEERAFAFAARRELEALRGPDGAIVGVLVRHQQALEGIVELAAARVAKDGYRMTLRIRNHTPLEEIAGKSRDEALLYSLVSTHTILGVRQGEFVSLLDPPDPWCKLAAACRNVGTWPVLVGREGEKDTLLSSPIILYDYPRIAPESLGDLFDATEIDEILSLRIVTLTEDEKKQMRQVDERARALLDRTEALARDQFLKLHGAVRSLGPLAGREDHD